MAEMLDEAEKFRQAMLVRDQASLERLAHAYNDIYIKAERELNALLEVVKKQGGPSQLTKGQMQRLAQYRSLMDQVETLVDEYGVYLKDVVRHDAEENIARAVKEAPILIREALAGDAVLQGTVKALDPRMIETLLGFLSEDAPLWNFWANKAGKSVADDLAQVILENVGIGRNPRQWEKLMRKNLIEEVGRGLTSALRTARTVQLWSYREANRQSYAANSNVVSGWQWVAQLDGLTCVACIALHGRVFPTSDRMRGHWNCRCTMVPVTVLQMRGEGHEMPVYKVAYYDENRQPQLEKWKDGEEWFATTKTQSQQMKILGRTRYQAWKDGNVPFRQFATLKRDKVFRWMYGEASLLELGLKRLPPEPKPKPPPKPKPAPKPKTPPTPVSKAWSDMNSKERRDFLDKLWAKGAPKRPSEPRIIKQKSTSGFLKVPKTTTPPPPPKVSPKPVGKPKPVKSKPELVKKLKTAPYQSDESPDRNKGAFESERVLIKGDGYAIRKPDPSGSWGSGASRNEAAAYEVAERLGIRVVPPTIYRETDHASFQAFVENARPAMKVSRVDWMPDDPTEFGEMGLLDALIGNVDRHEGNFLLTNDHHVVAIDHGLSFHSGNTNPVQFLDAKIHLDKYVYSSGVTYKKLPIPRDFRDRLRVALDDGSLDKIVSKTMPNFRQKSELQFILGRIHERGENIFNYWYDYFEDG